MLTVFKTSSQAEIASDPKTSLTKNQSLTWVFSILIHLECGSGVRHAQFSGFLFSKLSKVSPQQDRFPSHYLTLQEADV